MRSGFSDSWPGLKPVSMGSRLRMSRSTKWAPSIRSWTLSEQLFLSMHFRWIVGRLRRCLLALDRSKPLMAGCRSLHLPPRYCSKVSPYLTMEFQANASLQPELRSSATFVDQTKYNAELAFSCVPELVWARKVFPASAIFSV